MADSPIANDGASDQVDAGSGADGPEAAAAVIDRAALADENARLLATAERRAAERMALAEVGRAITRSLDPQAVLELIVDQACRLLGTGRSAVAIAEPEGSEWIYRFVARRGLSDEFPERIRPGHPRDGTTALAIVERRPVWSADLLGDPALALSPATRAAVEAEGYRAVLSVPLLAADRALGALVVYRDAVGPFASDEVELLREFADQAAIAIENARLHRAALRRGEELAALLRATGTLMAGLDLGDTLDRILGEASRIAGTPHVKLLLVDEDRRALRPAALSGGPVYQGFEVPLGTSYSGVVATTGKPLFIADTQNDPRNLLARRDREHGIVTYLGLPIRHRDQVLGVLTFNTTEPREYGSDDLAYLGSFADQAGLAIENARLFGREQERRRQLEAVRDVTAEITRELDLTVLLELIIRRSAGLVGAACGAVYLWDEAEEALIPRAWRGLGDWLGELRLGRGEGAVGVAAERQRGVIVNDYRSSPLAPGIILERSRVSAVLAEPILYQGRLVGAIMLAHEGDRQRFTESDRRLLELFAVQAAVAIENARLFEQAAALEALRELDRFKAEFLGTVSHELRTPLTLIHGYAGLLAGLEGAFSAQKVSEIAAQIQLGSGTMARLVDDLLDFSRLEQGRLSLERSRVAVADVLAPLVQTFRAQPNGERIVAELPEGLEANLDRDRLVQMVSNLLANALRYAPTGPIVLRAARRGDRLRVEVADEGPGIPLAERGRIWEKFYRGEQAISSPVRGTGLGLALVKQLVELHGGEVGVRSTPGRGATFWFTLPSGE